MKLQEYRDVAESLLQWLRDATALMIDRNFPNTIPGLKVRCDVRISNVIYIKSNIIALSSNI